MTLRYARVDSQPVRLLAIAIALLLALVPPAAAEPYKLPQFRTVDPSAAAAAQELSARSVRLLADDDFPPFSFAAQGGGPSGLGVELALAACVEARLSCEVVLLPYGELLPALSRGDGDAVISGLRLDETTLQDTLMTRPWFRTMGRFAVLRDSPVKSSDAKDLAGLRIGVIRDTAHARWLETYYGGSILVPFDDAASAQLALRIGNVQAIFGDGLQMIYGLTSATAQNCCKLLGGAYSDFDFFSRNIAILVRAGQTDLRNALDYGLDAAQTKGLTEKLFNAYVPLNPW
jgi:polar amino acid transport system substrate-binding protein